MKVKHLVLVILGLFAIQGCTGSEEHQYTKEQEKEIRQPTHQPPAEYKPDSSGGTAPPAKPGG